jgi:hypothetical protein
MLRKFLFKINQHTLSYIITLLSCMSGFLLVYFNPVAYLYLISLTAIIATILYIKNRKKVIIIKKNGD